MKDPTHPGQAPRRDEHIDVIAERTRDRAEPEEEARRVHRELAPEGLHEEAVEGDDWGVSGASWVDSTVTGAVVGL